MQAGEGKAGEGEEGEGQAGGARGRSSGVGELWNTLSTREPNPSLLGALGQAAAEINKGGEGIKARIESMDPMEAVGASAGTIALRGSASLGLPTDGAHFSPHFSRVRPRRAGCGICAARGGDAGLDPEGHLRHTPSRAIVLCRDEQGGRRGARSGDE